MKFLPAIIGFVVGVLFVALIGWNMMPSMMLKEHQSPYSLQETVQRIEQNAKLKGWVLAGSSNISKSVQKHGGGELGRVILINLCQADHAYNILNEDENKRVSVMMPCTISVYEKKDGSVYIANMNAGLLGMMFGGKVAEVMGGAVAEEQQSFIQFVNP